MNPAQPVFSTHPGPRERHLQRKLNNPLFEGKSAVTVPQVEMAHQQDLAAMEQFMLQFRELVQRAVSLDENVDSEQIMLLKAQLEQHYALCSGLPGESAALADAIRKLVAAISNTMRNASGNDSHMQEKLDMDERHTQLHFHLCSHAIVSDILNPDRIIADDELVPVLLNETEEGLQAALALFSPENIQVLIEESTRLLNEIEARGQDLPLAWERVAQMESWINEG